MNQIKMVRNFIREAQNENDDRIREIINTAKRKTYSKKNKRYFWPILATPAFSFLSSFALPMLIIDISGFDPEWPANIAILPFSIYLTVSLLQWCEIMISLPEIFYEINSPKSMINQSN